MINKSWLFYRQFQAIHRIWLPSSIKSLHSMTQSRKDIDMISVSIDIWARQLLMQSDFAQ